MDSQTKADDMDLRGRVVSLEHRSTEDRQRIAALETWRQQTEVSGARLDERFISMDKRLNRIDTNISRLVWLLITGIGGAFIAFVVKGGLNLH